MVTIGGHLHNRGINVASELVENGEYFCDSVAGYATGSSFAPAPLTSTGEGHHGETNALPPGDPSYVGRIEDMTGCTPMLRITAGDTIRLHSQYNSPSAQDDVMGIMIAYVHETNDPPNPDDDGDGYTDIAEAGMPLCGDGRNEDDFDDSVIDDGCPGGPPQAGAFSEAEFNLGSDPLMPCGVDDWPSDFMTGGVPDSTDAITITDITNFLVPVMRYGSSPDEPEFDSRWDLKPGRTAFTTWIAIDDLVALIAGPTGYPPMLGGARAFGGPTCPWPE